MRPLYCIIVVFALAVIGQAPSVYGQKLQPIDPDLQKLKANLAAAKHDTTRMEAYAEIVSYFIDLQLDSALVYIEKAEQLANKYPNCAESAKIWNGIGLAYKRMYINYPLSPLKNELIEKSIKTLLKSMEKAKQYNDEKYYVFGWFNLNMAYITFLPDKYKYFKSSLELINYIHKKDEWKSFDTLALGLSYKNICIEFDYDMKSKKFDEYLNKYKTLLNNIGDNREKISLLDLEQKARLWTKTDEQAFLAKYQSCKNSIKTNALKDETEHCLALYYLTIQDYAKSFRIMAPFSPNPNQHLYQKRSSLGIKFMIMGQAAYMLEDNQMAILYLNKALYYITSEEQTASLRYEKYTTLNHLSKAYKKAGDYKKALAFNEQANELYKQMHDVDIQALMAENDVHLEEIKQEKKLNEARTQTLLRGQEVEIEKKQKNILIVISILTLLSTAWALYSFIKTRKQNQIISQQATALEESNLLKDKIFALLSHDLRSPINRLVLSLNQSIESQRTHIQVELKGVQDILNNVLYWASIQLKKATPVYTNIPLQPLADALIDEYQYALEEKNITFLNGIDKDCLLKTDEGYLKIVLRNLISNAIKFTPNSGYIQIDCNIKEKVAQIKLRDTGVGIAASKLSSLFQLPMPSVGTNQEKGTGLGLSLSLDIVKKLGGNLDIQSQEGKGTQVEVALPIF